MQVAWLQIGRVVFLLVELQLETSLSLMSHILTLMCIFAVLYPFLFASEPTVPGLFVFFMVVFFLM